MELSGDAAHHAWHADPGLPPGHARGTPGALRGRLVILSTQKRSQSIYFLK